MEMGVIIGTTANTGFGSFDLTIVAVYLIGIMVVGILAGYRKNISSEQFFLAGKSLRWPMIGAALFTANISTIHLVGLAGSGYKGGLVWGNYEWMASFCLIVMGLVFAPFYFRSRLETLPEYLERRFSPGCRTMMALISILSALLIHIGISLYAGAKVFEEFFNIEPVYSIIIISVITATYTIIGGLKAIVVTDAIQAVILLLGASLLTLLALFALPAHGVETFEQFKAVIRPGQLDMVQPLRDSAGRLNELSWFSVVFGYPILGIWYWCSDQTIVQKVLGARSEHDAQNGAVFAGYLKILPVFVMVLPGVLGYVLFADKIGSDNDSTLLVMVKELLPSGLKGLMAAGLLAALMSTIEASLNSVATLTAEDIIKRLWPQMQDRSLVWLGRLTAGVVIVLAMFWSTKVGGKFDSIFLAVAKTPMIFAPAITCVFLWGIFWRRGTWQAALSTLVLGILMGTVYFLIDLPVRWVVGLFVEDANKTIVTEIWGIPFMQAGWWLFCLCSVVFVAVSLCTPKPAQEKLENLCWDTAFRAGALRKLSGITDARIMASALFVLIILLYCLLG